jgi:outer membrane protein, multidrug efflux system
MNKPGAMRYCPLVRTLFAVLLSAGILGACAVGPDYKRPALDLPQNWKVKQGMAAAQARAVTGVGSRWWGVYGDPVLDKLEDEALAHNADAQVAVARVLEARAQLGVTEADQYPVVSANVTESRTRYSQTGIYNIAPFNETQATLNASYELDLWGQYRRASEAARARLVGTEAARDAVRLSLTAQVAQQYFALLAYDAEETVVRRELAARQETLALDRRRAEVGVLSEYDLHQSEADEASVRSQLATLDQARDKQEAALALLLGRSPREVMDGTVQRGGLKPVSAWVPAGLPSELLLRRPDLKQAEMNLAALNADIGAARAQYFPSISLTSYLGRQSIPFSKLFTGEAGIFQFAASITQPIFNAGSLRNMVKAAEAARDQALVQYKRAVANAFADVRDALSEQTAARQVLEAETTRSKALAQAYKQAQLRYQSGISSHLDLLIVENNYLQAELNRLDAERAQRVAVADLFKALGGGWQDAAPGKPETP